MINIPELKKVEMELPDGVVEIVEFDLPAREYFADLIQSGVYPPAAWAICCVYKDGQRVWDIQHADALKKAPQSWLQSIVQKCIEVNDLKDLEEEKKS